MLEDSRKTYNLMRLDAKDLLNIANWQRRAHLIIALTSLVFWKFFSLHMPEFEGMIFLFSTIVVNSIVVYKLASALKSKVTFLWVMVGGCIPYFAIIVLFILSIQATKILQNHGVRIGWITVPKDERARLADSVFGATPPPFVLSAPHSSSVNTAGARRQGWADDLRELAKLRDEGIITEQEFNEKKRVLLGL